MVCIITGGFALVELPTIFVQDLHYGDYVDSLKPSLDQCDIIKSITNISHSQLKGIIQCFSSKVLGYENLLPYLFSVVLIPITYLFATELTHKRLVGIITILILVTSGNFYLFHSVSYEQSWVVFLFISLYLIMKGRLEAMGFYFLSILAKPIPIIYIPLTLYFITQYKMKTKSQLILFIILTTFMIIYLTIINPEILGFIKIDYNQEQFLLGLLLWFYILDSSWLVAVSTPLVIIKLIMNRKDPTSRILLIFIVGIIILITAIEGFTTEVNRAYRFVPLVIFVATGISYILSNWIDKQLNKTGGITNVIT